MLVKVRVLKELPQGQQPGDVMEMEEAVAGVFLTRGIDAVELYVDPTPDPPIKQRGRYRRTDLQAEKTADLTAAE